MLYEEVVVCPPSLKKHVLTTAAVDHNPSSTTASRGGEGWKNLGRQNMLPGYICLEKNYESWVGKRQSYPPFSASLASDSFHGTAVSFMNHL